MPLLTGRSAIVITASDRCFAGAQADLSGPAVATVLTQAGAEVVECLVLSDDLDALTAGLRAAVARAALVVTTGGTGLSARDNTPEATLAVCQRLVPGIPELIRQSGLEQTPFAALGRGVCGVSTPAGGAPSLVVNLPGSTAGAVHALRVVLPLLPHALDLLAGKTEHADAQGEPVESRLT